MYQFKLLKLDKKVFRLIKRKSYSSVENHDIYLSTFFKTFLNSKAVPLFRKEIP